MLLSFYLFMTSEPPNSHCVKSISLRIQSESFTWSSYAFHITISSNDWILHKPVDIWFYILYHAVVSVFTNFNIKFFFTVLCNLIGESQPRSLKFLSFL